MAIAIEYAISLGVQERDGLWLIRYANPLAQNSVESAYLPMSKADSRIGDKIGGIPVAKPGDNLIKVMQWLTTKITKYPYYWPWEGQSVDRYGYDFSVSKDSSETVTDVDISLLAYEIVRKQIEVVIPGTESEVIEVKQMLEAGGAYTKLEVLLERPSPVSEITINPFTKYPMELVSIMYEEDVETYHPRKELLIEGKKPEASAKSVTIKFPSITAKRFTIILRQKNYVKNTYLVDKSEATKKELWDKISSKEAEVTLDTKDGIETVGTKDIGLFTSSNAYKLAVEKYQADLQKWKEDLAKYNYYKAKLEEKKKADANYQSSMNTYRAEFKAAQTKYKAQYDAWEQQKADYDKAKEKYDAEMTLYNKQLRDLREWTTWGGE